MAKNITKRDLVSEISNLTCIPQCDVKRSLESFFHFVGYHMRRGETIEIRGFGTFTRAHRNARPARNPRTGEKVHLDERLVPILRFCDDFKKGATAHAIEEE